VKKAPGGTEEAQQAVALAPDSRPRECSNRVGNLRAPADEQERRPYYESALQQALTMQPDFQRWLVPSLKQRLAGQTITRARRFIRDQFPTTPAVTPYWSKRVLRLAKLVKEMVARDGIEPPTPAFSGPLTD